MKSATFLLFVGVVSFVSRSEARLVRISNGKPEYEYNGPSYLTIAKAAAADLENNYHIMARVSDWRPLTAAIVKSLEMHRFSVENSNIDLEIENAITVRVTDELSPIRKIEFSALKGGYDIILSVEIPRVVATVLTKRCPKASSSTQRCSVNAVIENVSIELRSTWGIGRNPIIRKTFVRECNVDSVRFEASASDGTVKNIPVNEEEEIRWEIGSAVKNGFAENRDAWGRNPILDNFVKGILG